MLRISPSMNWFQISEEVPLLLVIMFHEEWDGGEDGMEEKGGGSQTSVTHAGGLCMHIIQWWDLVNGMSKLDHHVGVLCMDTITDVWNPPPFPPIPSSPPSHSLLDMIANNEGISAEIWDQFVGGDVPSIAF